MGAAFCKEANAPPSAKQAGLGDFPEGCAAMVLMHLEPKDICKMARLNRAFRGASSADFVWVSKLPCNYECLVEKVLDDLPEKLCKKEVYARLCQFNSIDGGTKKVWLDKMTGGICLAISAKGLNITGIDDRRYWNHIPTEESRFPSIAYLQQIWWLEITGEVDFPFPPGTYSVFFRLQLGRPYKRWGYRVCDTDHLHGWDVKPVQFQLSTSDNQHSISQCFLDEPGKWVQYHVGDFTMGPAPTKLRFSMTQIDCTHTKGGLCVDSVVVYPSCFKQRLKRF